MAELPARDSDMQIQRNASQANGNTARHITGKVTATFRVPHERAANGGIRKPILCAALEPELSPHVKALFS